MNSKLPEYLPSVGRLLHFASHEANLLSDKKLKKHGLSRAQWVALTLLWRKDEQNVRDLTRYSRTTPSVMSRTLDRLERGGLVERVADPRDRRGILLRLTEKGRSLSHLLDFYKEINADLLEGFSEEDRSRLFELLERILANSTKALSELDP